MRNLLLFILGLTAISGCANRQLPLDEDLRRQQDALRIISEFSESICKDVPMEGSVNQKKIIGNLDADLTGLISNIAGLGFGAAGEYKTEGYKGLLQADLAKAFTDGRDCRIKLYQELQEKLLSTKPSAISIVKKNNVYAKCAKLSSEPPADPPYFTPSQSVGVFCSPSTTMIQCRYWKEPIFNFVSFSQTAVGPHITDGKCSCTCTTENADISNAPAASCQCFPAVICASDPRIDPEQLNEVVRISLLRAESCQ